MTQCLHKLDARIEIISIPESKIGGGTKAMPSPPEITLHHIVSLPLEYTRVSIF